MTAGVGKQDMNSLTKVVIFQGPNKYILYFIHHYTSLGVFEGLSEPFVGLNKASVKSEEESQTLVVCNTATIQAIQYRYNATQQSMIYDMIRYDVVQYNFM